MAETPDEIEVRLRAEFDDRLRAKVDARMIEFEAQNSRRSLRGLTSPQMNYDYEGNMVPSPINANNLYLKLAFITLVSAHQFGGGATEVPHVHLKMFIRETATH